MNSQKLCLIPRRIVNNDKERFDVFVLHNGLVCPYLSDFEVAVLKYVHWRLELGAVGAPVALIASKEGRGHYLPASMRRLAQGRCCISSPCSQPPPLLLPLRLPSPPSLPQPEPPRWDGSWHCPSPRRESTSNPLWGPGRGGGCITTLNLAGYYHCCFYTVESYVQELGGDKGRIIEKVLITNNDDAAINAIQSVRRWACEVFVDARGPAVSVLHYISGSLQ